MSRGIAKKKRRLFWLCGIGSGLLLLAAAAFLLVWNGVILLNNPSRESYPVRGVDVSSYQGDIDWPLLASQGIDFAFIKATEGSGFVDPCFADNFAQARETGLRIGAYHFFSYDSPGETQADRFIETVPDVEGLLPPVIDVEFYGDKERNLPDREETQKQLGILIERLEAHYGLTPILYATEKSYALYIAHAFPSCDIWIRNVVTAPTLLDGREWTFWQYTNRERLDGTEGKERFIDMNVFAGTPAEFESYARTVS